MTLTLACYICIALAQDLAVDRCWAQATIHHHYHYWRKK